MFPTLKQRLDTIATRLRLITPLVFAQRLPLAPLEYRATGATGSDDWTPILPGTYWGTWVTNFEMRGGFQIPADWNLNQKIALHLPIGSSQEFIHPEALIYVDGAPLATVDMNHQLITLPKAEKKHDSRTLLLKGWTGNGGTLDGEWRPRLFMSQTALVIIDEKLEQFLFLARTALETIKVLDDLRPEKYDLLTAVEAGFAALNTVHPPADAFRASVDGALDTLQKKLEGSGAPHPLTIHSTGHAHIDTAWLWTTAVSEGKVARTFHTALHLMDEYPEYIFAGSQPQHYEWFRHAFPESFERIKKYVKEKRWEILGGMWIESDCNVTGAESLVRQFLLGRRFFDEHFGAKNDTPVFFLPDAFGFPACLPQIAAGAGMKYFFTIKMRWSEVNDFPYDTFWWEGIDGTRLLTHMSTVPWEGRNSEAATYNANPNPPSALGAWVKMKEKRHRDVMMAYGWGDGGGGPTRDMIESIRAMKQFPGVPQHKPSRVREFYEMLEEKYGDSLPAWVGELYLETHQGTLTSQNRIKRWNHDAEVLLHDAEFLASYASLIDASYIYPHTEFDWAWHIVTLNQFHDILPGSSIGQVYIDAGVQFEEIAARIGVVKTDALDAIARQFDADALIINTIGFPRNDLVTLGRAPEDVAYVTDDDEAPPVQLTDGGQFIPAQIPGYSVQPLHLVEYREPMGAAALKAGEDFLENALIRVEFDSNGRITRLYDKFSDRELLEPGAIANALIAYEDRPAHFDAWNIDPTLGDPVAEPEATQPPIVVELGSLRATVEFNLKLYNSTITQRISLGYDSSKLTFDTVIDWQDRFVLLKVAFPVAVHASEASYGIQWGQIKRPTHSNTTWDAAKWEVAHHGWIDLSEADYGVSLLDDGIYGCDVRDNVMRLTLVKRGNTIDPIGDAGVRRMRYALVPHMGAMNAEVLLETAALNHPLIVHEGSAYRDIHGTNGNGIPRDPAPVSFVQETRDTYGEFIIETIKRSEDDQAFIIRLYEPFGATRTTMLTLGFPVESVHRANLLEEIGGALEVIEGYSVELTLKPFEIVTLRVVPARD